MKRKGKEHEATDLRQRFFGLCLRGHAPAKGTPAGKERKLFSPPARFGHRRSYDTMRERWRIGPLRASLHIQKLVAQRGNAPLGKAVSDGRHRPVRHARACAMREHEAGPGRWRRKPEGRNLFTAGNSDLEGSRRY